MHPEDLNSSTLPIQIPGSDKTLKAYHSNVCLSETYEKYYVAKRKKSHQSNKGDMAFTKQQIIQSNLQNSTQTSADTLRLW